MNLIHRLYRSEYDYHKIREFLTQTLLLNERRQVNWHLVRWDYWRWHVNANIFQLKLEDAIHLWETEDGALAAVLNPDSPGEAFLQIHPRHHTKCLVSQMLDAAEENLSVNRSLQIWAHERDEILQQALIQRGYEKQETAEHQRWQTLDHDIPNIHLPIDMHWTLSTRIRFSPRAVGLRGAHFILTKRMKNIKAGNGISTSNALRSIAATST